jgi:hypothetical protein
MYEKIRKGRATRVQRASEIAGETLDERITFNRLTPHEMALAAIAGRLTGMHLFLPLCGDRSLISLFKVNEMNFYKMHDHIAAEVRTNPSPIVPSRL